ncbi:hypothetical protein DFA_01853 [Cavenderia fasciculata]|uniref:Uncharacterized protein n=1 Tax=Cavenderia fasciculata TaxID=261658 RepID=F4PV59_CACFS|nr:uncharacterized protein DFA_01853 [Cavenderia fasciculata]EGG21967.1 hypothetical protein DFA_01853 [Cavenderia fasciculata]|eukprot:XP_004359818.1 hypothetical protein DFA_01853 [Cavenderia fasciculata]
MTIKFLVRGSQLVLESKLQRYVPCDAQQDHDFISSLKNRKIQNIDSVWGMFVWIKQF